MFGDLFKSPKDEYYWEINLENFTEKGKCALKLYLDTVTGKEIISLENFIASWKKKTESSFTEEKDQKMSLNGGGKTFGRNKSIKIKERKKKKTKKSSKKRK